MPTDSTAFNDVIFRWPNKDYEVYVKQDEKGQIQETEKYRVSYGLVRYICELDGGRSFRALRTALRKKNPSSQEDMEAILEEVLAMAAQSLLSKARERAQEPKEQGENEGQDLPARRSLEQGRGEAHPEPTAL